LLLLLMSLFEVFSILMMAPFMGFVAGSINLESSKFLQLIYSFANLNNQSNLTAILGFVTLFFFLVSSVVSMITLYILVYTANIVGAELASTLYRSFLNKDYSFHLKNSSTDLVGLLSFDTERTNTVILRSLQTNSSLIKGIFIIITLMIYNISIALILSLTFVTIYWIIFASMKGKFKKIGNFLSMEQSKIYRFMAEAFGSIKDIIITDSQNTFVKDFKKSRVEIANKSAFVQTVSLMPKYIVEVISLTLVVSLIIFYSSLGEDKVAYIITTLAVFGLGAYKLIPAFQDIFYNISAIKSCLPSFSRIEPHLSELKNFKKEILENEKTNFVLNPKSKLNLKNICFSYVSDKSQTSLKNINIEIKNNTSVGIVGSTGAGKSTFANIILGLLDPSSGEMEIDGIAIDKNNKLNWMKNISFVPQSLFLLEASIKQNIIFGQEDKNINYEKLQWACETSQLNDVLKDLKDGLNTEVGEKGIKLSGGQQQRIGIARAIYSDKSIIFFDEATSALDGVTENKVMRALETLDNKLLFMISHNFSTIKNCDLILFFKKGELAHSGSYSELLKIEEFKKLSEVS
jgi:ATP-binding cassette, subfamily B, bacterial PglK